MSSWRSSSSKGLLDPDAMLDLEDQLDYEPDGEEDNEDDIVTFTSPDFIQKSSSPVLNKEREQDSKRKSIDPSSDQDHEPLVPEPSGQEDQESDHASSGRQSNYGTDLEKASFHYGTDLEKASSVVTTLSFRDEINYNNMHVDVEKDSCRSQFSRHSVGNESYYIDSSSDEEFDVAEAAVNGGLLNGETLSRSQLTAEDASNLEDIYLDQDSQQDEGSLEDEYYDSSSESDRNLEAPKEAGGLSPYSATTVRVKNTSNVASPTHNQTGQAKSVRLPQKTKTDLNFSIKLVGNKRVITNQNSQMKRKPKPWLSRVGNSIDECDVVKLSSKDHVSRFMAEERKGSVKSRLGTCSDKSSFTCDSDGFEVFKVPLKRPPPRQKGNNKIIAVSVDVQTQCRQIGDVTLQSLSPVNNQEDKDDIISLMASSCHLGIEELEDRNIFIKDEPSSSLDESSNKTEKAKFQRTAQWVTTANQPYRTPVPAIYKGLCFKYFFQHQCTNNMCPRSHELENHSKIKEMRFLSLGEIKEAYEYAKEHSIFYGHIYADFADVFAEKDLKGELISMVNIIFEESSHKIDLEEGLNTVLNALQKTNLTTFEDTVEYLLLQIGLNRYPTLGNVLLEIICKKPDLIRHWPIVRRLIIAGQKLNIKLGSKFIVHLMKSPVNVTLCQEVYHHILKHQFIDFPRISDAIRQPFLKICSMEREARNTTEIEKNIERNLLKARFNFERTVQNRSPFSNDSLQNDFSMPPPTIGFTKAPVPSSLNYIPPIPFGSGLTNHQSDFASLSRQETTFPPTPFNIPPPTFESPSRPHHDEDERRSQSSDLFHDVDFRFRPPPEIRLRRYSTNTNGSSEDEPSPIRAPYSDSSSSIEPEHSPVYFHPALLGATKRPAPARMYKKEGLQYDPANDYSPPLKKQAAQPLTEFDRLKERGPVQRPYLNRHVSEPLVSGLNDGEQGAGPALSRPIRTEQGAGPTFVRSNRNDQQVSRVNLDRHNQGGAAFRPIRTEQGAGLTLDRPYHNDKGVGPALNKPNRTEQGAGPTLDRPNHNGHYERYRRQSHSELGAGPEYSRPDQEEQGAGPTFNMTDNDVQGAGPATRKIRSTNNRAAMVRRLEFRNNETAVSSSSDAKLPDEKPPEHPRFGTLYFDPNYEFNVSLHNSYLQAIDNVDIDEDDVHLLNKCVKHSKGNIFLNLVEKYKGPKTVQNFISMTLAHLKGMNQMVARTYQRLLDDIEKEDPGWYKNIFIRVILEVITMNLLFELFQRNMVLEANNLLKKFSHWDSLVTSRLFINGGDKAVSIIGRYLFLAKILNRCKPELAYEILVCPALHLLEKYEIWPYHPPCPIPEIFNADLAVRNTVIEEFLKKGYLLNTVAVIQLYKTAFKKPIWQFDVKCFVDPMVIDLISKGQVVSLKQINNEINIFCKFMDKDTLRAFLISMCSHISQKDKFKLYEKCVERKVYQRLVKEDSMEYTIEVKTNMKLCEIELIIEYFFFKLTEIKKVPSGSENLIFEIKLPGETTSKRLPILLDDNKSMAQINESISSLLKKLYAIDSTSLLSSVIEVQKEALVNYLEQRWI